MRKTGALACQECTLSPPASSVPTLVPVLFTCLSHECFAFHCAQVGTIFELFTGKFLPFNFCQIFWSRN